MKSRKLKLSIIACVLCVGLAALWEYETSGSCCHVSTVHAQDDPEEGNPSHTRPEHGCNATGQADKGEHRVACKCSKYRKCDGVEPKQCRSWCFKDACFCPDPCS